MDTQTLKALIEANRLEYYPKAKPWPNGLGFDHRNWTFGYDEQRHKWVAWNEDPNGQRRRGYGDNPFDAYAHARKVEN